MCGNNEAGQLGFASRSVHQMPHQVDNYDQVSAQISCGKTHTLILTKTGCIYACGSNQEGQLGIKTEHNTSITPVLIEDISHITMSYVAAGSFSASISKDTGSLYLWGTGTFGQFFTPHRVKKIEGKAIQVAIGDKFGLVMTEERDLYTWGINDNGQLGSGDFKEKPTP